jgi:site-specific DNA-cytosine methylase
MPIRQRDGDASHHDAGLFDRAKPPYRVPSMASVRRLPPNGLVVASLFAGGGGSSTGYRMAGFRVAWANEFVREAAETYAANHPGAVLDRRDVRLVRGEDVLRACGGRLDVLDGSPPCQAFSTAGKREAGWGEVKSHADGSTQRSDDLFDEYVRILREARPRAFVAENVPGLILGAAKGYFKKVLRAMREAGYEVEARLLDAQWLGVPQQRQRLVFVGFRRDLGLRPAFPSPLPYRYTVADALPWVRRIRVSKLGWEAADRPARTRPRQRPLRLADAVQAGQGLRRGRLLAGGDRDRAGVGQARPGPAKLEVFLARPRAPEPPEPDRDRLGGRPRDGRRHAPDREAEILDRRAQAGLRLPGRLRPDRVARPGVGPLRELGPAGHDGSGRPRGREGARGRQCGAVVTFALFVLRWAGYGLGSAALALFAGVMVSLETPRAASERRETGSQL